HWALLGPQPSLLLLGWHISDVCSPQSDLPPDIALSDGNKNMPSRLDEGLARFKRDPDTVLTGDEIDLLLQPGESDTWVTKALVLHYAKKGEFAKLRPYAERLVKAEPTSNNLINLAVTYRGLKEYSTCIEVLTQNEARINPIRFHDLMCSNLAYLGK